MILVFLCGGCASDGTLERKQKWCAGMTMCPLWPSTVVLRSHKRRKYARSDEWLLVVEGTEILKSPDGVKVKSPAVIEDSDSDPEYLGSS